MWIGLIFGNAERGLDEQLTLKAALYGIPMGRLAKTAKSRFARGDLKARLWEISWMARKRFWFAVAPMM